MGARISSYWSDLTREHGLDDPRTETTALLLGVRTERKQVEVRFVVGLRCECAREALEHLARAIAEFFPEQLSETRSPEFIE